MIKLTRKTIQSGQVVTVVPSQYRLSTISRTPGFQPDTELKGWKDISSFFGEEIRLETGEKLEIIGLRKDIRAVTYRRLSDGKIYDSWLGSFTSFTRLI